MTENPHSRFPAWVDDHRPLVGGVETWTWVLPMDSKNTHLQYGRFSGLSMQSLRPLRDDARHPITHATADGKLRGLVDTMRGYRHIDVTAAHGMGAIVNVHPWPRQKSQRLFRDSWAGYGLSLLPRRVTSVRAVRLRVLAAERQAAPWIEDTASTEEALEAWDTMLRELFELIPTRYRAQQNPWCWVHHLEEDDR